MRVCVVVGLLVMVGSVHGLVVVVLLLCLLNFDLEEAAAQ